MPPAPRIAINGFGRIGRLVLRALRETRSPVEVVAVNDLSTPAVLAHLFEFDSVHGRYRGEVAAEGASIVVDGRPIRVLAERDPAKLPWRDLGVDYVVEATGRFTDRAALSRHLDAGATRVVLTAPGKDPDVTLVRGVNDDAYDPARHRIVSNASCTTNCLAPVLKVLDDAFGVEHAQMTTIHAYTNDQALLDAPHEDLRRARAAALSIVPTSTGAGKAIGLVLPRLAGKVDGLAFRVPVPHASIVDVSATVERGITKADLEGAFDAAAAGPLAGILAVERRPLVSSDFAESPESAVVDLAASTVSGNRHAKVLAWYSNEWAYSLRTSELVLDLWERERGATGVAGLDAREAVRDLAAGEKRSA